MYTAAPLPYSSGCLLIQVNLWGPTIHRQNVPAKAPMRQPRTCGISMECIVKDCMVGRSKEVQTLGATLIGYNFWSGCQSDYCYILTDSLRWMEAVEKILKQKIKTIKKRCNTRTSLEVTLLSLAQACWIADLDRIRCISIGWLPLPCIAWSICIHVYCSFIANIRRPCLLIWEVLRGPWYINKMFLAKPLMWELGNYRAGVECVTIDYPAQIE